MHSSTDLYVLNALPCDLRLRQAGVSCLALVLGSLSAGFLPAQENQELLALAADIHEANREKIRTWSGHVRVTDSTIIVHGAEKPPAVASDVRNHEIFFATRIEPRMLKWDFRLDVDGKAHPAGPQPTARKGLVRDGTFTEVRLWDRKNRSREITVKPERNLSVGPRSMTFDPMYVFTHGGYGLAERFRFLHGLKNSNWKVERADHLMKVTNEGPVLNQYVVNMEEGATLVSYEGRSPQGQEVWEWEFQRVDEVWVPRRLLYQNTKMNPAANGDEIEAPIHERTRMRLFEWTENKVNQPIPDDEFTYTGLGIEDGDWISDRIKGETYRYDAEP